VVGGCGLISVGGGGVFGGGSKLFYSDTDVKDMRFF